jgi:IS6 family transposase
LASLIEDLFPAALHNTSRYENSRNENNRGECDHGQLEARLRPMRGLKTNRTASAAIRGHAFIQDLRRRDYELVVQAAPPFRLAAEFDELRPAI